MIGVNNEVEATVHQTSSSEDKDTDAQKDLRQKDTGQKYHTHKKGVKMAQQKDNRYKKSIGWNPEKSFDSALTLEDLIKSPPFKDAGDPSGTHPTSVRLPTWLVRRIAFLTENSATPYQLHSDVVRDAVYIGLRVLSVRYKSNPQWEAEARMAKAVDKVGTIERLRTQIKNLRTGLEALVDNGDTEQAVQGLEEFLEPVIEIEDEWYKTKIIQFLSEEKVTRQLLDKCSAPMKKTIKKIQETIDK